MIFFNTEFKGDKIRVFGNYTDVNIDGIKLMDFDIVKVTKGRLDVTEEMYGDIDSIRESILDNLTESNIERRMNINTNITEEE